MNNRLLKLYFRLSLVLSFWLLPACTGDAIPSEPAQVTPISAATSTPAPQKTKPTGPVPASAKERGFFLLPEFHAFDPEQKQLMNSFLKTVQAEPKPVSANFTKPLKIAFAFPSLEPSDAWARLNITIRKRLDEVKIPYEVSEFLVGNGQHQQQTAQIDEILAGDFDYVVIGPSEYKLQKPNLERLAKKFPTLVMNVVNPFVDSYGTDKMPLTHVGFDHSAGAYVLCRWAIEETGGKGTFALMRYVRGVVDEQRSDVFAQCVQENSNLILVDEYDANGEREQAFIGTNVILNRHPDITMIHSGSTAIALGALAALNEQGLNEQVLLNGWGGGADELAAISNGKLDVTVFRVNDDWGVAVAEAIKTHAEGKNAQIPAVIAATIKIIDYRMSATDIARETDYAFRYSGELSP